MKTQLWNYRWTFRKREEIFPNLELIFYRISSHIWFNHHWRIPCKIKMTINLWVLETMGIVFSIRQYNTTRTACAPWSGIFFTNARKGQNQFYYCALSFAATFQTCARFWATLLVWLGEVMATELLNSAIYCRFWVNLDLDDRYRKSSDVEQYVWFNSWV